MTDLIALSQELDRCWVDGRLEDLQAYIAEDVVLVAPGGHTRLEGLPAAVESYRGFIENSHVTHYRAFGHRVTQRGDTAVIEYGWEMAWEANQTARAEKGQEVLVLARRSGDWRVVWRTQLPSP